MRDGNVQTSVARHQQEANWSEGAVYAVRNGGKDLFKAVFLFSNVSVTTRGPPIELKSSPTHPQGYYRKRKLTKKGKPECKKIVVN